MAARVPALDGAARPRAPPPAVVGRVLPPAVAVRGLALVIAARVRVPPLTVITVDNGVVRSPAVHDHRAVVLPPRSGSSHSNRTRRYEKADVGEGKGGGASSKEEGSAASLVSPPTELVAAPGTRCGRGITRV
ncbi:hypothetical protein R3P38DRAFT_3223919 [Favolaschia claudopus]